MPKKHTKKQTKKPKYPDGIYVRFEKVSGDDAYLVPYESPDDIEEGEVGRATRSPPSAAYGCEMKKPRELMASNYCGPSRLIALGQLPIVDGYRFIGIDRHGKDHFCIVRLDNDGSPEMCSNTAVFGDLCGWLPDTTFTAQDIAGADLDGTWVPEHMLRDISP